jgi:3-hydroxybutyryl-CoA dehydrogenase
MGWEYSEYCHTLRLSSISCWSDTAQSDFRSDKLKRFVRQFLFCRQSSCDVSDARSVMEIKSIGVIGAGTMGNGIAHVFARNGYAVVLCDVEQRFLERGIATITKNLDREVAKNKITEADKASALAKIEPVTERARLGDCDFLVEAATEKFEIKTEIFRDLDRWARPEVILASNTSSISITKLGALTTRPDKVIGMHFFNPVPVMKLVEVIRGLATTQHTFESVRDLAIKLDKTPVEVNDAPGFVSNRVLMPLLNEAMYAVMEGVATAEAVDEVFKLGMAHPMGPLTLADFIGLDVCLDIMRVMLEGLGDPKYRPCPLLIKMVDAGWLGRKSGRGFYKY